MRSMEVLNKLKSILIKNGFKEHLQDFDKSHFGNYYAIYEKDSVFIRMVVDRSVLCVDVASKNNIEQWFDLQLFKGSMETINFSEEFIVSDNIEWLGDNIMNICDSLDEPCYKKTIEKLNKLQEERARLLFPRWYDKYSN